MQFINQFCTTYFSQIICLMVGAFLGALITEIRLARQSAATESEHNKAYMRARRCGSRDGFKSGALQALRSVNDGPDALREFVNQNQLKG
jgi:hypothetical protein